MRIRLHSHWKKGWVEPRDDLAMATKVEKFIYLLGIEETWSSALYQHCVVELSQHYLNSCTVIK